MSEDRELTVDSIESTESFLSSNGIEFETIRHPAVMTVEEMVPHKGLFGTEDVVMAKHLFLHDKKKKDAKAWLVIAGPDEKIGENHIHTSVCRYGIRCPTVFSMALF